MIVIFTKYDQFRREMYYKLEDSGFDEDPVLLDTEVERMFNEHYRHMLRDSMPFVRLESEDFVNQLTCILLICVV